MKQEWFFRKGYLPSRQIPFFVDAQEPLPHIPQGRTTISFLRKQESRTRPRLGLRVFGKKTVEYRPNFW